MAHYQLCIINMNVFLKIDGFVKVLHVTNSNLMKRSFVIHGKKYNFLGPMNCVGPGKLPCLNLALLIVACDTMLLAEGVVEGFERGFSCDQLFNRDGKIYSFSHQNIL